MRLASLSDLKTVLEKTDGEHDTLLAIILDAVSAGIEGTTHRKFQKLARTEYFDAGGNVLQLKAFPIDSSTPPVVVVDDETYTENDDYKVFYDKGYIEFMTDTVKVEPRDIHVTYTGGYDWTVGSGRLDVPLDLVYATLIQAAYNFRNRKNIGVMTVSMPDGSISMNSQDEFLPQVRTVLERYEI